jgi:hypothetical protein
MTAYGIYIAMKRTALEQFNGESLEGKTVAVQGVTEKISSGSTNVALNSSTARCALSLLISVTINLTPSSCKRRQSS